MRGHAFLTSSSADEVAQESEGLGGSFFTHYLTSGMRGAADVSGDGKITLNEAYQFAFHETLGGTVDTRGGAQHPAYDIQLSGTGDVVMTDVRQTSAGLILSEALQGRCFVRNADDQLVVELQKPLGRSVQLGLEPGAYRIHCDLKSGAMTTTTEVAEGAQVVVGPDRMAATERQETVSRGTSQEPRRALAPTTGATASISAGPSPGRTATGARCPSPAEWSRPACRGWEAVSTTSTGSERTWPSRSAAPGAPSTPRPTSGFPGTRTESTSISAFLVGVRWYPVKNPRATIRPWLTAQAGAYVGSGTATATGFPGTVVSNKVLVAPGLYLGGGLDFRFGSTFVLGVGIGGDLPADFSEELSGSKNYRAFQVGLSFGFTFGKGHTPPR